MHFESVVVLRQRKKAFVLEFSELLWKRRPLTCDLSLFVSLHLVSVHFVVLSNTVLTPPPNGHTLPPLHGQGLL